MSDLSQPVTWLFEAYKSAVAAAVAVAFALLIGNKITLTLGQRQKERELGLAAATRFFELYGEFFAVWKLWIYALQGQSSEPTFSERKWQLLQRASAAEGGVEALLVKMSSEPRLVPEYAQDLGRFRQGYQQLREAIRENVSLDWSSSEDARYRAFKKYACSVASLLLFQSLGNVAFSRSNLELITSNKWEGEWWKA